VREIPERPAVDDPARRQIGGEQRKLALEPLTEQLGRLDLLPRHEPVVVDQAEARLPAQRNDPEPQALVHEVIGREPLREVADRRP
jgi:hypothetical protein